MPVVYHIGSSVSERLMRVVGVVFVEVGGDSSKSVFGRDVGVPIHFVLFQAPPQTLRKDIVHPSSFSIHTDSYSEIRQCASEIQTGELTSLVDIEDVGYTEPFDRIIEAIDAKRGFHIDGELP